MTMLIDLSTFLWRRLSPTLAPAGGPGRVR